jgi:ribonuclease HI
MTRLRRHPEAHLVARIGWLRAAVLGANDGNVSTASLIVGVAAAAAALGYKGYWRAFGEYLGNATNQQAEIAAAAIGLEKLSEPCKVRVLTDSRYVVQTMQGNFRKKANLEWWAKLEKAAQKHKITWEWVKGHAGHDVQEIVDTLARKTAELGRIDEVMFDELIAEIGVKEI